MRVTKRGRGAREPSRAPDSGALRSRPRFGMRVRLLALVAIVGVAAAACGSSGAAPQSRGTSVEAKLQAFSRCMRAQGITDMPDPTVDSQGNVQIQYPPGAQSPGAAHDAFTAARSKCNKYLQGVTQGYSHSNTATFRDQVYQLARCLRARGADVPDPDFSGGGHEPGPQFMDAINRLNRTNPALVQACLQKVFGPGFAPGGHGGGGH
jgi:hypothetical protein